MSDLLNVPGLKAHALAAAVTAEIDDTGSPVRGALNATYFDQRRMVYERTTTIPAGVGWGAAYGLVPVLSETLQGKAVGSVGKTALQLFNEISTADSAPGATFATDAALGLDTNPGTYESPFRSIHKAISSANASGLPTRIVVKAGIYTRGLHFDDGTGVLYPTVDISFQSYGKVVVGNFDEVTGFAADGTYTNTYVKAVANCDRLLDLLNLNKYGNPVELLNVPTPALANVTPNSWTISGGNLYIHRADGAAPSGTNTRYFRTARNLQWTTNKNIYFGGDGFDIQGGITDGPVGITGSAMAADGILAFDNCTFRWGGAPGSTANGVTVTNRRGLAVFTRCKADANAKDGFNMHHSGTGVSRLLTINCQSADNGRNGQSCNSWTIHEACLGIDVAGVYRDGHGGTVHNIGTSKAYLLGTHVSGDAGDLTSGGAIPPTGIKVGDTAQIWAERVTVDMPAGEYAYATSVAGASIHKRDCAPTRQADFGPGTFDTF